MSVELKGPSPLALTAGILLLSRARSFGLRLEVGVVGDPDDIVTVSGPALLWNPVLASCGVGRELGEGSLVLVPGLPSDPLALSLSEDGLHGWFTVDRSGRGAVEATRSFIALCRDPRAEARLLGRDLRRALADLGCTAEPAVLDVLFGAPAAPLSRLALALRAGRSMSGGSGAPITSLLQRGAHVLPDPLPSPTTPALLAEARADGRLDQLLACFSDGLRADVLHWLSGMDALVAPGQPDYSPLLCGAAEIASHLMTLPPGALLPPLPSWQDHLAQALGGALGAVRGTTDASASLRDTFRFLGGKFLSTARYPILLDGPPPPADRLERWAWLAGLARQAADTADTLWRRVMDPVQ